MLNNNEHVRHVSVCTLFNGLLVGGQMPIVFYTLLIDTININAVHLHNAKLTDLFAENESRADSTSNRGFQERFSSIFRQLIFMYYQNHVFYKNRNKSLRFLFLQKILFLRHFSHDWMYMLKEELLRDTTPRIDPRRVVSSA